MRPHFQQALAAKVSLNGMRNTFGALQSPATNCIWLRFLSVDNSLKDSHEELAAIDFAGLLRTTPLLIARLNAGVAHRFHSC